MFSILYKSHSFWVNQIPSYITVFSSLGNKKREPSFSKDSPPSLFSGIKSGVSAPFGGFYYFIICFIVFPISAGLCTTLIPHSFIIFILAAAVSSAPPTIAPACPILLPGGAVCPAIKDRKSTRLNSSHIQKSRMPSSA